MKRIYMVASLGISCWASFALAASPVLETFDNDTAGFVGNTISSVVVHVAGGGNPDGHIQTRKDLAPPVFDIGALTERPEFSGDYAAAGIGHATVDLNFMTDNVEGAWLRFRPGPASNGWLFPLTNSFPTNVWNTYSVDFDPTWSDVQAKNAGWLTDDDLDPLLPASPAFADVLAAVDTTEVRIASEGSTVVGIDNVGIAVPEPASALLGLCGLLGLSAAVRRR